MGRPGPGERALGQLRVRLCVVPGHSDISLLSWFLDAIASPSTYACQSVGELVSLSVVIHSFRLEISELCELV